MPMLFYGTPYSKTSTQRLYGKQLNLIESSVFDQFCIRALAPYGKDRSKPFLANHWFLSSLNHSAMSWHDERMIEQTVFIPTYLSHLQVLCLARETFTDALPSSLVLRFANQQGPFIL